MHLILTGATGLVGGGVLHHMLNTPQITAISILSRRPVPQAEGHEKAKVIIHKDFESYPPELLAQLKGAEGCVWAQGISSMSVDKVQYEKITETYPLLAAQAFSSPTAPTTKPFKFIYVSGEGATTTTGMLTARFGVVKGRTEAALLALSKRVPDFKPYSVRPGGVDPVDHPELQAFLPQRGGLFGAVEVPLRAVVRTILPRGMFTPTKDLGKVLTDLACGNGVALEGKGVEAEGRTVSNVGIRRIAGI